MLKEMYKQLPKSMLRNKWDLTFIVSEDFYNKQKHLLFNDRFLGIKVDVLVSDIFTNTAMLSERKLSDFYWKNED